ncbi:MAG: hypothetical protein JRG71_10515 [Deltaproteobacteria bacterium]|nr:hypothetical protein [Deltaproteobacteria bacterium]
MWDIMPDQTRVFLLGRDADTVVAQIANECSFFVADDEDEWVADEECSCYNCRYRRWTQESFRCMAG